jgi:hypothetical protein
MKLSHIAFILLFIYLLSSLFLGIGISSYENLLLIEQIMVAIHLIAFCLIFVMTPHLLMDEQM